MEGDGGEWEVECLGGSSKVGIMWGILRAWRTVW